MGCGGGWVSFRGGNFRNFAMEVLETKFFPRNSIDEDYHRLSLHSREWKGKFLSRRNEEESGNCAI